MHNRIYVALGLLEPKYHGFTISLYISIWHARTTDRGFVVRAAHRSLRAGEAA